MFMIGFTGDRSRYYTYYYLAGKSGKVSLRCSNL